MYIYSVNMSQLTHGDKRLNMNCVCLHVTQKILLLTNSGVSLVFVTMTFPTPSDFLASCNFLQIEAQLLPASLVLSDLKGQQNQQLWEDCVFVLHPVFSLGLKCVSCIVYVGCLGIFSPKWLSG